MNANDVIESYVTDVAVQLPRKQRNDVAFELRALLNEGLQDKAEAAGRAVDAAMAIEVLRAFGRPDEVAARYRPTLTIIDPADGYAFLRSTIIGLVIIWFAGLLRLQQPSDSTGGFLGALGQWWGTTVIPSLQWPGLLVVGFGAASWAQQRWPQTSEWKPRAGDRIQGGRATLVLGIIGILCGIFLLVDPHWILDFFWSGRAAPAAYQALTYTDTFLHRQALCLLALLLLNIPLFITVIVQGRWSTGMRRMETVLGLVVCVVMLWTVLDGPILMAPAGDQMAKVLMVGIVVFTLIGLAIKWYRSVSPSPGPQTQATR